MTQPAKSHVNQKLSEENVLSKPTQSELLANEVKVYERQPNYYSTMSTVIKNA
jgi:hypothetical protein